MNVVALTHDGSIYWNGKEISRSQLDQYLTLSHRLNPEPNIFLETEMGGACSMLEAVRDQMDKALECRQPYARCSEGIQSVWRDLSSLSGAPIS